MKIETRGSTLEGPSRFADALAEALPEVISRIDDCLSQLLIFVRGHLPKLENNHAAATVFNQAANDFSDLCFELVTCRGRPALRASRALFEHLINYRDVTDDPESQQRYEQHHAVAAQVEADAEIGLNRLTGDVAKSVRHMLRKLRRDSKKDYDKAIASYGSIFKARWAKTDLRERAKKLGLDQEYEFYRLASMVLHGSAGGAKGTLSSAYPAPVHRTGAALQLCPPAYVKGLTYFRSVIEHAGTVTPEVATQPLIDALSEALALWPDYRRVLLEIDAHMWPEHAPAMPRAVLAISRNNRRRWYLWDPTLELVVRAEPPASGELAPWQKTAIEQIITRLPPGDERADDWTTISFTGVRANPKPDAPWIPAGLILVPKGSDRIYSQPRQIDLRQEGELS